MQRSVRYFLLSAIVLAPAATFAAVIQPVGYSCSSEGCNANGCNSGGSNNCQSCNSGQHACNPCQNGDFCQPQSCNGNCGKSGRCNMRSTRNDFATNWCGQCGPTGRLANRGCRLAQAACWCCKTKAFPDSGWAPPTMMRINRTGTGFQSFMSSGGSYAGAPMVYQPTDTAQLGYIYAHVPTWQRNQGMVPPTPYPSNFHGRFCPPNGNCGPSAGGSCFHGGQVYQEQSYGSSCQSCQQGHAGMMNY